MNKTFLTVCVLFFSVTAAFSAPETASLKIKIVNGSGENLSGKGFVRLFDPGNHMRIVGEKPVQPELIFDSLIPDTAHPYLIRVLYEEISYSAGIFLNKAGRYDTALTVYSVRRKPGALTYSVPHWFVFIHPDEILFEETIEINNPEPFVILPAQDTLPGFVFTLPKGSSLIDVSGGHDSLSPLAGLKAMNVKGVYGIPFQVRPGASRIHIRYFMRHDSGAIHIHRTWLQDIQYCNLIVFPSSAKLSGEVWTFKDDAELKKKNYALYKSGPVQKEKPVRFELADDTVEHRFSDIRAEDNIIQHYSLILLAIFLAGGFLLTRYNQKRSSR